jgi:hypothetical protein
MRAAPMIPLPRLLPLRSHPARGTDERTGGDAAHSVSDSQVLASVSSGS